MRILVYSFLWVYHERREKSSLHKGVGCLGFRVFRVLGFRVLGF